MIKKSQTGMTLIVKTVTRLTTGLILLFGIYIVFNGHIESEGGFAGGVIIALSFIHLMLAYGKEVTLKKMNEKLSEILENLGAIIFIICTVLAMFSGGYFLSNVLGKGKPFELFSVGTMLIYNIAISLIVSAGLFSIFITLVFFRSEKND
ncbi:MAG: MnhB domain-containing protein [Elusimicrobia bacterium]|nr:MnhB domain-containing protein [Elusimicrobiota bacterium]